VGQIVGAVVVTAAWRNQKKVFCCGWRVAATIVPKAVATKLRPEAPPFIPAWQQKFFDIAASELHTVQRSELAEILDNPTAARPVAACRFVGDGLDDDLATCAFEQQLEGSWGQRDSALTFWMSVAERLQHVAGHYPEGSQRRARLTLVIRIARAMAAEELTMEIDIRKYDMFGARLQVCEHIPGDRGYKVHRTPPPGRLAAPPAQPEVPAVPTKQGTWSGFQGRRGSAADKHTWFLMIEVKGLPEQRPEVVLGDAVFIRSESTPGVEYACLVAALDPPRVALLPPQAWWTHHGREPAKYPPAHIRLGFDKVILRRMGMALIRTAEHGINWLPQDVTDGSDGTVTDAVHPVYHGLLKKQSLNKVPMDVCSLELCNPLLNKEQREAVHMSVCQKHTSPLILFGPAGTGKTLTLTEVILQAMQDRSRGSPYILACAPTAFAADILCAGLAKAGLAKRQMVRLNDIRRLPAQVREGVLQYCMQEWHEWPSSSRRPFFRVDTGLVTHAQVVVASCSSAALLAPIVRQSGGFDYVIMDEAAQALIPEALIPLSLAKKDATVVLAGDPQQLGPSVRCQYSAAAPILRHSLQQAWLLHNAGEGGAKVCMLPRNYRSSAPLLELPSRMFYDECLIAEAPESETRAPEWEELTGPDDATVGGGGKRETLFYGVMGQQVAVDPMVPSWSNPLEAHRCVELISGLLESAGGAASYNRQPIARAISDCADGSPLIRQEDVGVMAPFRKQVYELRRLLRAKGLHNVRVGTVDDFQGQEARVVFISTTLSRVASLREEEAGSRKGATLGTLLSDQQRFCVAITRAQALLVVVGHPVLLLEATTWRNLITHCAARGAYKGAGAEKFISKLGRGSLTSTLTPEEVDGIGDSEIDLAEAVDEICQMAVLGYGDVDSVFPDLDRPEALAAAYGEETPWRVAL